MTAPEDDQESWEWIKRVEEQYQERFGEPIQAEMLGNPYERAEEALERGEPIDYPRNHLPGRISNSNGVLPVSPFGLSLLACRNLSPTLASEAPLTVRH